MVVEGRNNNNEQQLNAVIKREMRNKKSRKTGAGGNIKQEKMTLKQAMKGKEGRATGKQHTSHRAHCE